MYGQQRYESLAAKAQAVVGAGDVGGVVWSGARERGRPSVDVQLYSRQGCVCGSIHSSF